MISEVFIEIIDNYLIPKATELYGRNWNLHQDNDPKHTSDLTANYFQFNHVIWVNKIKTNILNE